MAGCTLVLVGQFFMAANAPQYLWFAALSGLILYTAVQSARAWKKVVKTREAIVQIYRVR